MTQLHPNARWIFRSRAFFILIWIGILPFSFFIKKVGLSVPVFLVLWGLLVLIGTEAYARLAYQKWNYEFTADELKLERGIIWKKYTSLTYNRVQNIDIRRSIYARLLGYSTVDIETAGDSDQGYYQRRSMFGRRKGYQSEGHLPAIGVEEAEKIRTFIMKKISSKNKSGM